MVPYRPFACQHYTALSALDLDLMVYMSSYSMSLPLALWDSGIFPTFVSACLSAGSASFLTIKSGSGEETDRGWKDERRDGWKEQEVHGAAERREDVLGTVETVMINKCALGASLSVCSSGCEYSIFSHSLVDSMMASSSALLCWVRIWFLSYPLPLLLHTFCHHVIYNEAAEFLCAAKRDPFRQHLINKQIHIWCCHADFHLKS